MKIRFRRPPNLSALCSTSVDFRSQLIFRHSFCLDRTNIRDFISLHTKFDGKFVFDRETNRIALCPGEDTLHEQIAYTLVNNNEKKSLIGAFINFKKKATELVFKLDGDSGQYGQPEPAALRQAAELISGQLKSLGYSPTIRLRETSAKIIVPLRT